MNAVAKQPPSKHAFEPAEKAVPHARVAVAVAEDDKLSIQARHLFTILCGRANREWECWHSRETLGAKMGCSARTISRYLDELSARGIIERVKRQGLTSVYRITANYQAKKASDSPLSLHSTPDTHDKGTYDKGVRGTPSTLDTDDKGVLTPMTRGGDTGVKGPLTPVSHISSTKEPVPVSSESEPSAHTPESEKRYPVQIDSTGSPILSTIIEAAQSQFEITEKYLPPVAAWIETRPEIKLPRMHDVRRIRQLVDQVGPDLVTRAIRKMGDQGKLKIDHLPDFVNQLGREATR